MRRGKWLSSVRQVAICVAVLAVGASGAASERFLHSFLGSRDAEYPQGTLIRDTAGNLYGTSVQGGDKCGCGTIFMLSPGSGGWTETVLYAFKGGSDGIQPYAGVVFDGAGNLYGTTTSGGTYHYGTVFELERTTGGWTESVLYSFTGASDGAYPYGSLVLDGAGNLYGTTNGGGSNPEHGTVFELTHNAGGWTESVLYAFAGGADAAAPYSGLVFDAAGNLFGTTHRGGSNDAGAVFELTPSSSGGWQESIPYSFGGARDGSEPIGPLVVDPSGNFFGTTVGGGFWSGGTVFELTPTAGGGWTKSTLHDFKVGKDGAGNLFAGLTLDAAGDLYGTTCFDGIDGAGTVFELKQVSGGGWTESRIHVFTGGNGGANPQYGGVVLDSAGNLYGTTNNGGAHGVGIVFELTQVSNGTWKGNVLHNFTRGMDGEGNPYGKLVFDAAGNLYGTTFYGGTNGLGSVFELIPTATGWREKLLHNFGVGTDGIYPYAGVAFDAEGNLYGTTRSGGSGGHGTVFQLTPNAGGDWTERVLYAFTGGSDGGYPGFGSLTLDASGNLYGTTSGGGVSSLPQCTPGGCGTVFQLTHNSGGGWTENVIYAFNGENNGGGPIAGVIFDSTGNLYGTTLTSQRGNSGGVAFKLTPSPGGWTESVLYNFASAGGIYAGLIFDDAGNLYGSAQGFVYQLKPGSPNWTMSVVYNFASSEYGDYTYSGVTCDSAGNLYGVTFNGGSSHRGTVFKLTHSGTWTESVLHTFGTGNDGIYPQSDLTLDAEGNLYGTTVEGGQSQRGIVFEIR